MTHPRLERAFFARDAGDVARDLLGTHLCVQRGRGTQRARIVETEAYVGPHDLACHASRGVTPRTRVMYGPPGRTYVYLIYGMHAMLNFVTGDDGDGQAVLVRAAEPLECVDGRLDGPGRLTHTLAIGVQKDNDRDLDGKRIWLEEGDPPAQVVRTPRVGVDYAGEWAAAPLRFIDPESHHLSVPVRG